MGDLPVATGASMRKLAKTAPVRCPRRVTRLGSAPKAPAFSRIQLREATISLMAKFPEVGLVWRKPVTS